MTESGSGSSYGSPSDPVDQSTPDDGSRGGAAGREWVSQLQSMIDNVTTQAAPILRDIAAKAAELAAAAGDKAGPIAHKAADATEAAGAKLAERGRGVAADLRRDPASGGGEGAAAGDVPNAIQPGPGAQSAPANPRPGVVADSADSLGE